MACDPDHNNDFDLVSSALLLAGSLGENWYGILEALQNADYVLNAKALQASTNRERADGVA
jgi:hypothetical protein